MSELSTIREQPARCQAPPMFGLSGASFFLKKTGREAELRRQLLVFLLYERRPRGAALH